VKVSYREKWRNKGVWGGGDKRTKIGKVQRLPPKIGRVDRCFRKRGVLSGCFSKGLAHCKKTQKEKQEINCDNTPLNKGPFRIREAADKRAKMGQLVGGNEKPKC